MRITAPSVACLVASALAGCGPDVAGTWVDPRGPVTYTLDDRGSARITVLGFSSDGEYTVSGDKVIVSSPQGSVVLKLRDGRLHGPLGMVLLRRPGSPAPAGEP